MNKIIDWKAIQLNRIKNCTQCKSKVSYTNPFSKCFECKKKFCFDCCRNGMINKKMGVNEEIRVVCDDCVLKHKYEPIK